MTELRRLRRTADLIAGHADYPGKQELIRGHIEAIEGPYRRGELGFAEWAGLMAALLAPREGRGTDRLRSA